MLICLKRLLWFYRYIFMSVTSKHSMWGFLAMFDVAMVLETIHLFNQVPDQPTKISYPWKPQQIIISYPISYIYTLTFTLFFHNSLLLTLTLQPKFKFKSKNKKGNNLEEWVIYRFNKNPRWSLTNRNNPWLFQHHQCFIVTLTATLSNAVHHRHLLLTNHHPRSILLTQAISPVMASLPLHFLSVSVAMLFTAVYPIHAPCQINPCRLKGCQLLCRLCLRSGDVYLKLLILLMLKKQFLVIWTLLKKPPLNLTQWYVLKLVFLAKKVIFFLFGIMGFLWFL